MTSSKGASRVAGPGHSGQAPEPASGLGHAASVPLRGDLVFTVDEFNQWSVFDKRSSLGTFPTWADAEAFRKSHSVVQADADAAPAWTPKSGGY